MVNNISFMVMSKNIDKIKDTSVNCYSVMTQFQVGEYLKRVKNAFENRGGLEGQRDTLKTNTAIRIRKRMIKDIEAGAVLPPIVIGVIIPQDNFAIIEQLEDNNAFLEFINKIPEDSISIIDGMQRTKALSVALKDNANICDHEIRVEFWIASQINSLIYRMLVLNTGQVPWDIRRQIETVFQGIIKELKEKFPVIEIIPITDKNHKNKRSSPGQFQSDDIIELFLVFGAKKVKIDIPERLAEEFIRLDFISSTSNPNLTNIFYEVMFPKGSHICAVTSCLFVGGWCVEFVRGKQKNGSPRFVVNTQNTQKKKTLPVRRRNAAVRQWFAWGPRRPLTPDEA
ncbi:MAG: hypothetical protein RLZZ184_3408, partial [Cyanobacteriota bacterium]